MKAPRGDQSGSLAEEGNKQRKKKKTKGERRRRHQGKAGLLPLGEREMSETDKSAIHIFCHNNHLCCLICSHGFNIATIQEK